MMFQTLWFKGIVEILIKDTIKIIREFPRYFFLVFEGTVIVNKQKIRHDSAVLQ